MKVTKSDPTATRNRWAEVIWQADEGVSGVVEIGGVVEPVPPCSSPTVSAVANSDSLMRKMRWFADIQRYPPPRTLLETKSSRRRNPSKSKIKTILGWVIDLYCFALALREGRFSKPPHERLAHSTVNSALLHNVCATFRENGQSNPTKDDDLV